MFFITPPNSFGSNRPIAIKDFEKSLNGKHLFSTELLLNFKNHLVACGGAITKRLINTSYNSKGEDIDLFFYNLSTDEANNLRRKVIEFLIDKWKNYDNETSISVVRNEYVTTIYVYGSKRYNEVIQTYQLIHRIYPDISSILGGFDISACMVAYDGEELYATPLGLWSIRYGMIITDTKRRSTSFEYRLCKYFKYGFTLILPGLSEKTDNYFNVGPNGGRLDLLLLKIKNLAREEGYTITSWDFLNPSFANFSNIQKQKNILPTFCINDSINYCRKWEDYQEGDCSRNLAIGTIPYNRENIEERFLKKISDYNHDHMYAKWFPHANAARLRMGNLNAVVSILNNPSFDDLLQEEKCPDIKFIDEVIRYYENAVEKIRFGFISRYDTRYEFDSKADYIRDYYFIRFAKCFGKLTPEVFKVRDSDEYYQYRDIMIETMIANAEICREKLTDIKWLIQDPGRQWTSSINPIIADPREWYDDEYVSVLTGIPENIENCLRLARLRSIWSLLPDEIFNLILLYVMESYANDAWKYI
jgi:hypothetical protein